MLYPLLFNPLYKEMVWGGARMQKYGRTLPSKHTGESWDVTCRPNEMSVAENGPLTGKAFADIIACDRTGWLGRRYACAKNFPLLIKIIDANDNLSVQVHPGCMGEQNAKRSTSPGCMGESENGKNEMWYVMEAPAEGSLIVGLREGVTRERLQNACEKGTVEEHLYRLPVKRGDMINIPAGLVHALTRGVMVAEVQQNADITYRLYDYNRLGLDGKPRALHIQESMDTIDFTGRIPTRAVPGLIVKKGENRLTYAIANRYFAAIKYALTEPLHETSNPDAFCVFTCVGGHAQIVTENLTVELPESRSVLIPAARGEYELRGEATLLKSFVPDIAHDFIAPLIHAGYTEAEIRSQSDVE